MNESPAGPLAAGNAQPGSQALARGLRAFLAVVEPGDGMTVQQVAALLGVHRTMAYRLLQTLLDFGLIARSPGGAYVPGARLATLAESYVPRLQEIAMPVMQRLADELASTVLLFIEQNGEAAAISMAEPTTASHHIAFRPGMRTPMDRGAAAFALAASRPPLDNEPDAVREARDIGHAHSYADVLPGAYGVAAGIPTAPPTPVACLTLVTYIASAADRAGAAVREAANEVAVLLSEST